ncbi:hypothetical protein TELCIR_14083 [Teladorsagia circumcincta]|uniref:Uncharacterized protein n=1 Tax=Teladorsagia circumcincta TaxID=45464 RepID=A0A2G9U278_TELCI|nr:hypothetical protein TELCIR_14083 [Teladorsagia circumcincta]
MYMNKIYENEEDGIEIFLNDEDFETVRKRKEMQIPKDEKNLRFEPRYAIRPTIDQIVTRLDKYWDMKAVEYNEGVPDGFEVHSEFFLPDGQFGELLKEMEEQNAASSSSSSAVSKRRSRRGGSPDSTEHQ